MAEIHYFDDLKDKIYSELDTKLGSDEFYIEKFWSDDYLEAIAHLSDNRPRLSNYVYILVSVNNSIQRAYRQVPTDTLDRVSVDLFIAARDNRDTNRAVRRVEKGTLLSQAYLSNREFSIDFSSQHFIEGWEKRVEWEDDELVLYSLTGNLDLELDLKDVITTYES